MKHKPAHSFFWWRFEMVAHAGAAAAIALAIATSAVCVACARDHFTAACCAGCAVAAALYGIALTGRTVFK